FNISSALADAVKKHHQWIFAVARMIVIGWKIEKIVQRHLLDNAGIDRAGVLARRGGRGHSGATSCDEQTKCEQQYSHVKISGGLQLDPDGFDLEWPECEFRGPVFQRNPPDFLFE